MFDLTLTDEQNALITTAREFARKEVAPVAGHLDEEGEPDHALLRRAAGSKQSDEEIAPYRYGPPMSPHLAAKLAGEEIEPGRFMPRRVRGSFRGRALG